MHTTQRPITIRCTLSRGPRGFFCLHDVRRGPVNVAVIGLGADRALSDNTCLHGEDEWSLILSDQWRDNSVPLGGLSKRIQVRAQAFGQIRC